MKVVISFFAAVIAVAALASFCTLRWAAHREVQGSIDSHEWLHQQLGLSGDQRKALEPIEARFAERERDLRERMHRANRELGDVLSKSKSYSPEVAAAVEKVHHEMGELQKVSIEHLYEMRALLTPAQNEQLLKFAEKALREAP